MNKNGFHYSFFLVTWTVFSIWSAAITGTMIFLEFPNMMESAKLGIFLWRLLEKENMRTVVLATLNTILHEDSKELFSMDLLHEIFADRQSLP